MEYYFLDLLEIIDSIGGITITEKQEVDFCEIRLSILGDDKKIMATAYRNSIIEKERESLRDECAKTFINGLARLSIEKYFKTENKSND